MQERKQIVLFLVSTRLYKQFVPALIEGVKEFFLLRHDVTIELFTDEILKYEGDDRVKINQTLIVSYKFPFATLYRYRCFVSKKYECDYYYYLDVDMKIAAEISENIFGDVVAVRHPGFYRGGGSWETNENSLCYTLPENRIKYFAGGFQGGAKEYYRLMVVMSKMIDVDEYSGIMPVWQDESAWNCVLSYHKNITELDPSYCLVEQKELRIKWGINEFPERIIALFKDHKAIRQ